MLTVQFWKLENGRVFGFAIGDSVSTTICYNLVRKGPLVSSTDLSEEMLTAGGTFAWRDELSNFVKKVSNKYQILV